MDFTKFVSLLECKSLFFSRVDRLGDPFEGSLTNRIIEYVRAGKTWSGGPDGHLKFRRALREWLCVNCWHMNEQESAAMWKVYTQTAESVAIVSSYRRLRDAIDASGAPLPQIFIGQVSYVDYATVEIPVENMLWPYMHKRRSFAHERELRAIYATWPGDLEIDPDKPRSPPAGHRFSVDLDRLVESVR